MAGNYFGYDGPFPPFNDSLVHHYVFTLYALAIERAAGRRQLHRRRGAPGDPPARAGRGHALGHLHAEPAPARLTAAATPATTTQRADARPRDPPWRDRLERRDAASRASSTCRSNATGRWQAAAARARRSPTTASPRSIRATCSAPAPPPQALARGLRAAGGHRRRPARARLRRLRRADASTRSSSAGPSRPGAGAAASPTSRRRAASRCASSTRAASPPRRAWPPRTPGQTIALVAHGGVLDCLYRAATRIGAAGAALVAARQRQHQPAAVHRRRASRWSAGATRSTSTASRSTRPTAATARRPLR